MRGLRKIISRNLINRNGWKTDRNIVLFESDDWGSIRMPSKETYKEFLKMGVSVNKSPYCRYDALASEGDLEAIFSTLHKHKDLNGNPPIITANTIVGNPDFKKIRETDFNNYYYEPFTKTLERNPGRENSFQLWQQGIQAGLFSPQFHGREHLNVQLWMRLLQENHSIYRQAFDEEFWGIDTFAKPEDPVNILAAFDTLYSDEVQSHEEIIITGITLFREIFGYQPESFIAPNYIWDSALNQVLKDQGITSIQGMKKQIFPYYRGSSEKRKMVRRFTGEINRIGQVNLVRNCVFEPALKSRSFDSVGSCLKDIANAFLWKRPAIITTHRLNYIGSINQENRSRNLKYLNELLTIILKRWPETEFMSSDMLGNEILTNLNESCVE